MKTNAMLIAIENKHERANMVAKIKLSVWETR